LADDNGDADQTNTDQEAEHSGGAAAESEPEGPFGSS
jgi:hypothetical protein